jgi:hypothetical protein
MPDIGKQEMYKELIDENGIKFMLVPKDVVTQYYMKTIDKVDKEEEEENDNPCHWCRNNLNKEEQAAFDEDEGNWVAWCGLDKYATCDDCMATMCEVCKGPCEDVCEDCDNVCHDYCETITYACIDSCDRCTCNNPPKDRLTLCNDCGKPNNIRFLLPEKNYGDVVVPEYCACSESKTQAQPIVIPFEITLDNLNNYSKKRLQDENVKYGLARCENETKDKTISKLTGHLEKLSKYKTCTLKLDDDEAIEYRYPNGKSRLDLNKVLNDFFSS